MSATTVMMLVLPVAFLAVSVWFANRSVKRGAKPARAFFRQVASFAVVCLVLFAAPMIASPILYNFIILLIRILNN